MAKTRSPASSRLAIGERVARLVDGQRWHVAAEGRARGHRAGATIDEQTFGPAQSAPDEVVENRPPGLPIALHLLPCPLLS
jgi:hypothetical protein